MEGVADVCSLPCVLAVAAISVVIVFVHRVNMSLTTGQDCFHTFACAIYDIYAILAIMFCTCERRPEPSRFPAGSPFSHDQHTSEAELPGGHQPSGSPGGGLPGPGPSTSLHPNPRVRGGQHARVPVHRGRSAARSRLHTRGSSSPQQLPFMSGSARIGSKLASRPKGRQLQCGSSLGDGRDGPHRQLHERERQAEVTTLPYAQQSGYPIRR